MYFRKEQGFKSIFQDGIGSGLSQIWQNLQESQQPLPSDMVIQGRMYQKNINQKKWIPYHYELFYNIMTRACLSQEDPDPTLQFMPINSFYLKQIKLAEPSANSYQYGFRLYKGEQVVQIFCETSDQFNQWHDQLKRLTIQTQFQQKYKILGQLNYPLYNNSAINFYKCHKFSDSMIYMVRVVEKQYLQEQLKNTLVQQISVLRNINHQCLLQVFQVYQSETSINIVTEMFSGKDLKTRLYQYTNFDQRIVSQIIWRILHGLNHLHQQNIFHRDVKLQNILMQGLNNVYEVYLANFFVADYISQSRNQNATMRKCGTPGYIAPEIFKQKIYNQKIDIYSLGVSFYLMIFGKSPFEGKDQDEILKANEKGDISFDFNRTIIQISTSGADLLQQMLDQDPEKRPSAAQLINHHWFVNIRSQQDNKGGKQNFFSLPTINTIPEKTEFDQSIRIFPTISSVSSERSSFFDEYDEEPPLCQKLESFNQRSLTIFNYAPSRMHEKSTIPTSSTTMIVSNNNYNNLNVNMTTSNSHPIILNFNMVD